jgi:molybdenum cofactor sulfurtransferase
MALLRPSIDLDQGLLHVTFSGAATGTDTKSISIPLSSDPALFVSSAHFTAKSARVCGDSIAAQIYQSEAITDFFSQSLGVDCMLARFPAVGYGIAATRHAKANLQPYQLGHCQKIPGAFPNSDVMKTDMIPPPILLSNESPILVISRSSLNRLNEQIKDSGGRAVHAEVFRANIVVAENPISPFSSEEPYAEDSWRMMHVGRQLFQILGSCRRCQMVCINQETGLKSAEPFVTLARTRRFDGKVFFGQHACHIIHVDPNSPIAQDPTISVGDAVRPYLTDSELR